MSKLLVEMTEDEYKAYQEFKDLSSGDYVCAVEIHYSSCRKYYSYHLLKKNEVIEDMKNEIEAFKKENMDLVTHIKELRQEALNKQTQKKSRWRFW